MCVLDFERIKPRLNLSSKGWVIKETLSNVQYIWVTLIWVNNNYFAWKVILNIELWIKDYEDENRKTHEWMNMHKFVHV
jgi:hypothetical protein